MTETFIPGKDASLESSIAKFQTQLANLGFQLEEVSWLNPLPGVWSVHIRDRTCPLCFSNGKGASKKAALASALGEYFERLSTNYFFADFWLGAAIANGDFVHYPDEKWFPLSADNTLPTGILDPFLRQIYDADNQLTAHMLVDLQSGNAARGICALPFVRQSDNQVSWIPVNIIGNLYVSNGMSCGNSRAEARVQALAEIFERYVKQRIIAEAISLPEIPNAVLQRYPLVLKAVDQLQQAGFPLYLFDASLGGVYPVIAVVLFNPAQGSCFASFGAHPAFGVALERTVTELLQGRSLQDLDVFMPPSFDNDEVADHANIETHFIDSSGLLSWDLFQQTADYPFTDWDFSGSTEQEFAALVALLHQAQREVYIADYQHLGADACRILVPGMSEIYPAEDLLLANNNMGLPLREKILQLPRGGLAKASYLALFNQLDAEGLDDFTRVRELLGLAAAKQSGWFTLRIGELKSMLALAGGDLSQALLWAAWTLDFNHATLSNERANYYRCLQALLTVTLDTQRDISAYLPAFTRMYGAQTVADATAAIHGESPFYGLEVIDEQLSALPTHQTLLAVYHKLQSAKRCHK